MVNARSNVSAVILLFVLSGVYLFVFSESGILERISLENKKLELLERIDILRTEKKTLKKNLDDYRKGVRPDSDVLHAGYISPGDKLVVLRDDKGHRDRETAQARADKTKTVEMGHYRLIWIVISILVFILFISKKHGFWVKSDDE